MNSPNDPIDKLLREQESYITDDGFTQRVVAALPKRRPAFQRIILLAVVIVGAAMAAYWMPWKTLPPLDYAQLWTMDLKVVSAWLPFITVGVALTSAVWSAFRREN
jgi:hypothetical protein